MRVISKSLKPAILSENEVSWLSDFVDDPTNQVKRTRYRHPDIKAAIRDEAHNKCIYCESKVGHNTPGDVEHLRPSSKNPDLRFRWENLSLACNECNRRKGDYDVPETPFLNPYEHDVEDRIIHLGPMVSWVNGDQSAEISIRKLKLNDKSRLQLILRKIEKMQEIDEGMARYHSETNATLKELIFIKLLEMAEPPAEFSGMVKTILAQNGLN